MLNLLKMVIVLMITYKVVASILVDIKRLSKRYKINLFRFILSATISAMVIYLSLVSILVIL